MRTILFIISLFISFSLMAQKTRVIEFGSDSKDSDNEYKLNIVKTSPVSFIFGKQPIEFERELTDYLSVQAGIGLTFPAVLSGTTGGLISYLIDSAGETQECNSEQWTNDYCDDIFDPSFRKTKLGFNLSISPRLWFSSDGIEGSYIAPVLRYITYRSDAERVIEGQSQITRTPDSFDKESTKNTDFVVHYGYQWLNDAITWEYFVGLGVRNQKRTRQDLGYEGNRIQNGTITESDRSVLYDFGIRVGFRF